MAKKAANKNSGIMKKYVLSDEMADFMGKSEASRAEIVKKIWQVIKKTDGAQDGRTVYPQESEELSSILGSRSLTMFQIAGKISPHLVDEA